MRFLTSVSARNTKLLLIMGIVVALVVAGTRVADLLRLRKEVSAQREELEETQLIAAIQHQLAESERLSYDDVGIAGEPLPPVVIEKLKANYRLPNEDNETAENDAKKSTDGAPNEPSTKVASAGGVGSDAKKPDDGATSTEKKAGGSAAPDTAKKKLLTAATTAQLRSTLGVDERTARFIAENANVGSWDELGRIRRQLFEENEDAIEPLIVARVSKFAAESGIEKIDQFKVEPPKSNVRRARAVTARTTANGRNSKSPTATKPSATTGESKTSSSDVNAKLDAVREQLKTTDADALLTALDDLVNVAYGDDASERVARAGLEELVIKRRLAPIHGAPIQLAAIRLQPPAHFVTTHLVEAYATRALRRLSDEGDGPVKYTEEPFPPLVMLPRPVQRRLLEALSKNGGAWFTNAQVREILGTPPSSTGRSVPKETSPAAGRAAERRNTSDRETVASAERATKTEPNSKPNAVNPVDTDETKLRAFHAELVDMMWRVAQLAQRAKSVEPNTYTATLLFKCNLEQLVNFVFKLENDVRWLRVSGLRVAVEQPDPPLLGVTLSLEASVLKSDKKAGT
jgi:hypothetical protein